MPGFMIKVQSNARGWYLAGAILFELIGIALTIAGFAAVGAGLGVVGIVVAAVSTLFLIDAAMNFQ